jgi:predicted SnoaL-like aldol condensation-catalyzing enzyme
MLTPEFADPDARFEVKRILVDVDLAMVRLHGRSSAADPGRAVAGISRRENGTIVEHWDVAQPMPENSVNPPPMF